MQEVKKPHSQDVRADPAWSINSGKIEFNPRDFHGSRWLRALESSSGLKRPEVSPSGVGIFHRWVSCLLTSLVDLRSLVLCAPFYMSCEAMEYAETGHRLEELADLTVSFLMGLHTMRLQCEKSMEFPASSHQAVKTIASKMSNLR